MKTLLEYIQKKHISTVKKEIHSYKDLSQGQLYAIDYEPEIGEYYTYLGVFKEMNNKHVINYIGIDIDTADINYKYFVNANTKITANPKDIVRDVTDKERDLLNDILKQCDLSNLEGKLSIGYINNMKFTKE